MLIGIDASRAVASRRTGTEGYALFLIQALCTLTANQGQRLRLYFNQAPPPDLFPRAAHVERVVIPLPRLWTHLRLAWQLRREPPDVFFTPAHVIPLTYRGPGVATIHDMGYRHFPEAHPRSQLAYLRWSTRHNARISCRVVADSRVTKTDLIHFDGVDSAKIDVIYPGVDPTLRPVSNRAALTAVQQKYQISPPYFLYLGTLQPRKNLIRLIQAHAASQVPHQLVLAGKPGWLSRPILEEVNNYLSTIDNSMNNSQTPIIMPGFISDVDKAALISGASALLFPSLYEGFGFPVLEAQACGTAVLCANTSSLPEVAGDGALMVDPLDTSALATAIQQMAIDSTLLHDLVQKGFENVKRFTWQKTAAQVLTTLEKALL
jgi:glycosyltransferase involved in cell wall biosynthesis